MYSLRVLRVSILICCLLGTSNCRPPPSPCPNIFAYEGDFDRDRWFGVISFTSNIELAGINIKIQLDRPSELLVAWDGEVRSTDNTFYHIFNPYLFQKARETMKIRIMVKFNSTNDPPPIVRIIVIDGTTVCSSGQILIPSRDSFSSVSPDIRETRPQTYTSGGTTERYDPTFNNNQPDLAAEFANKEVQAGGDAFNYNRDRDQQIASGGSDTYDKGVQVETGLSSGQYDRDRINSQNSGTSFYDRDRGSPSSSNTNQYIGGTNQGSSGGGNDYYSSNKPQGTNFNAVSSNNDRGSPSQWHPDSAGSNNPDWSNNSGGLSTGISGIDNTANKIMGSEPTQLSFNVGSNYNNEQYKPNNYNNQRPPTSNRNPPPQQQQQQQQHQQHHQQQQQQQHQQINSPVVTTLTIPQNAGNINQIVELIKSQLENQNVGTIGNNTYIVAVVNPSAKNSAQQLGPQQHTSDIIAPPMVHQQYSQSVAQDNVATQQSSGNSGANRAPSSSQQSNSATQYSNTAGTHQSSVGTQHSSNSSSSTARSSRITSSSSTTTSTTTTTTHRTRTYDRV